MGSRRHQCYSTVVIFFILHCVFLSGVLCMNFTCRRVTTPCDNWYGQCQPDGRCACSNGASGLQCQISGTVKRNAGNCLVYNPCAAGTCYDDGVVARCDCPEGLYGEFCQHPMVYAECDVHKMVMNVRPYGYDSSWSSSPPLTGNNFTCPLDNMATFLKKQRSYEGEKWEGFASAFAHKADSCAGDSTVVSETSTSITYSRTVYISYSSSGPDVTDQTLEVTCDVKRYKPTPAPIVLPPPRMTIAFKTPRGRPVTGPMKLGSQIYVHFNLNIPNSGHYDDAQVETCTLRDNISRLNVVIVDRACAIPPVGETLYKKGPGVAVLIMYVYKFPGMSNNVSFQCHVRVCMKNIDNYCSTPAHCPTRGKRSLNHVTIERAHTDNIITVESSITF